MTNAVDAIESLNALLWVDTGLALRTDCGSRHYVMMFLVATPHRLLVIYMGGAGFGLIDASADGEVASPVNLGIAERWMSS